MKLLTLEGTFHNGKIDLDELPAGLDHSRVFVTFLDSRKTDKNSTPIRFGELASPELVAEGRYSTEEDFKIAEYKGDKRWDDDNGH